MWPFLKCVPLLHVASDRTTETSIGLFDCYSKKAIYRKAIYLHRRVFGATQDNHLLSDPQVAIMASPAHLSNVVGKCAETCCWYARHNTQSQYTVADTSPDDRFQLTAMLFRSLDRKIDGWILRLHWYTLTVNQISGGQRWTTRDSAPPAHTDRSDTWSDTHQIGVGRGGQRRRAAVPRYLVFGRREQLRHLYVALLQGSAESRSRVGNGAHFSRVLQRSAVIRCQLRCVGYYTLHCLNTAAAAAAAASSKTRSFVFYEA